MRWCKVGTVDCLVGGCIKLSRKDSLDGLHHFIPSNWIERIEDKIYMTKNANDTRKEWDFAIGARYREAVAHYDRTRTSNVADFRPFSGR